MFDNGKIKGKVINVYFVGKVSLEFNTYAIY